MVVYIYIIYNNIYIYIYIYILHIDQRKEQLDISDCSKKKQDLKKEKRWKNIIEIKWARNNTDNIYIYIYIERERERERWQSAESKKRTGK